MITLPHTSFITIQLFFFCIPDLGHIEVSGYMKGSAVPILGTHI